MVEGIERKGHIVIMDNYFTCVGLSKKLLNRRIYAIVTMQSNHIGLPIELEDTKEFNNNVQGTLDWRVHDSRKLSCVV